MGPPLFIYIVQLYILYFDKTKKQFHTTMLFQCIVSEWLPGNVEDWWSYCSSYGDALCCANILNSAFLLLNFAYCRWRCVFLFFRHNKNYLLSILSKKKQQKKETIVFFFYCVINTHRKQLIKIIIVDATCNKCFLSSK